jgi:hypothetical protein
MPKRSTGTEGTAPSGPHPALTPLSAVLGGIGILAILAGFFLLSRGSITAAPLLLVAGYAVLVPLAIIR